MRLSPAQLRFLNACLEGAFLEPKGRAASAWLSTMRSLRSRGLVETVLDPASAVITAAGKQELARAAMNATNVKSKDIWKAACVLAVDALELSVGDLWDEGDPYDLIPSARAAFAEGQSPQGFIEETFAEDLARAEHDEHLYEESLQYE
jgi:hypothetical protein